MKNAVAYVRVSHTSQVDNFSLDSQEEYCKKKAKELGCEELKIFREEGISAKSTDNRPQLQEMLAYCKSKKNNVSVVIVYSFSRFSRNTTDFLVMKNLLKKNNIGLVSCTEPSGDSPEMEFLSIILSGANELDNKIKGRVVSYNMKARLFSGLALSRPPIGYKSERINGKPHHVPDEPMFSILKSMWLKIKDEEMTLGEVHRELNKLQIRNFSLQFVTKIFSNKYYMGTIVSPTYGEVKGKHIPMIDEKTFYRVRELIKGRKTTETAHSRYREDFPLRGVLICEYCGMKMSAAWTKGKNQYYPYYACRVRGIHKIVSFNGEKLQTEYLNLLDKLSLNPEKLQFFMELLKEEYYKGVAQREMLIKEREQELKKLKAKRNTLMQKHLDGIYTDKEYLELKDKLDSELASKSLVEDQKRLAEKELDEILEYMKWYFSNLGIAWDKASFQGKNWINAFLFPKGVVCQREGLRTPELARCYNIISDFTKKTNFRIVGGKMQLFEHLDWIDLTTKKELSETESSLSRA